MRSQPEFVPPGQSGSAPSFRAFTLTNVWELNFLWLEALMLGACLLVFAAVAGEGGSAGRPSHLSGAGRFPETPAGTRRLPVSCRGLAVGDPADDSAALDPDSTSRCSRRVQSHSSGQDVSPWEVGKSSASVVAAFRIASHHPATDLQLDVYGRPSLLPGAREIDRRRPVLGSGAFDGTVLFGIDVVSPRLCSSRLGPVRRGARRAPNRCGELLE